MLGVSKRCSGTASGRLFQRVGRACCDLRGALATAVPYRRFSFYINLHRCCMGRNLRGSFYSNFISYLCTVAAQFLQWDKFFHRTAQGYSGQYLHKFTGRNRPRGNGCVRSSHAYACSLPHSISQEHKRSRCAPALRASAHPAKPGRLAVPLTLHGDPSRRGVWGAHSLRSPSRKREGAPGFRISVHAIIM